MKSFSENDIFVFRIENIEYCTFSHVFFKSLGMVFKQDWKDK